MANVRELRVNGKRLAVDAAPDRSLLSVLRDDLELTGAHYGCGEGQCGACTVLVDGAAVRSCVTSVGAVAARQILTVEGLERESGLHPIQQAFLDAGALQCGYCTSGMLMSAAALLKKTPRPTRKEIIRAMNGNICRCGAYPRILDAISRAAAAGETRR